ncbi:MAG: hypothetical protein ACON5J_19040 [Rubripirellula sp.]
MKKKEEISDALGTFLTILGVGVAVGVGVPLVVFVATFWPYLLWLLEVIAG